VDSTDRTGNGVVPVVPIANAAVRMGRTANAAGRIDPGGNKVDSTDRTGNGVVPVVPIANAAVRMGRTANVAVPMVRITNVQVPMSQIANPTDLRVPERRASPRPRGLVRVDLVPVMGIGRHHRSRRNNGMFCP